MSEEISFGRDEHGRFRISVPAADSKGTLAFTPDGLAAFLRSAIKAFQATSPGSTLATRKSVIRDERGQIIEVLEQPVRLVR